MAGCLHVEERVKKRKGRHKINTLEHTRAHAKIFTASEIA